MKRPQKQYLTKYYLNSHACERVKKQFPSQYRTWCVVMYLDETNFGVQTLILAHPYVVTYLHSVLFF
jgi:hypothetical protein